MFSLIHPKKAWNNRGMKENLENKKEIGRFKSNMSIIISHVNGLNIPPDRQKLAK